MSTPAKGQADYLELGDWNAACFVCGRKGKASEMYKIPVGLPGAGGWAHNYHEAYKRRQPQDLVRGLPDKMSAPWSQLLTPLFITDFCEIEGRCGICNFAVADCAICEMPPMFEITSEMLMLITDTEFTILTDLNKGIFP